MAKKKVTEKKKPEGQKRKSQRELDQQVFAKRQTADKTEEYFQRMGAEKQEGGYGTKKDGKVEYSSSGDTYYGVFLQNGFKTVGSYKYIVEGENVTVYRLQKKTNKKGLPVLDKFGNNELEEVKLRTSKINDILRVALQ